MVDAANIPPVFRIVRIRTCMYVRQVEQLDWRGSAVGLEQSGFRITYVNQVVV